MKIPSHSYGVQRTTLYHFTNWMELYMHMEEVN